MKKRMKNIIKLKSGESIVLFTEEKVSEEITIKDIQEAIIGCDELSDFTTGFDVDGNLIVIPTTNINYITMSFVD